MTSWLPLVLAAFAALVGMTALGVAVVCLVVVTSRGRAATPAPPAASRAPVSGGPPDPPEDPEAAALSAAIAARQEELRKRAEAIRAEIQAGWPHEVAEGRAAMKIAGFDPDRADQAIDWNARLGVM